MSSHRWETRGSRWIVFALAVAAAQVAFGQLKGASISRPSEGPSSRVDLLGGLFSSRNVNDLGARNQSTLPQSLLSVPSFRDRTLSGGVSRPTFANPFMSNAARLPRTGNRRPDFTGDVGRATRNELMYVTEYAQSMDFQNPFGGYSNYQPDIVTNAPYFVPPPTMDRYAAFFRLVPAAEATVAVTPPRNDGDVPGQIRQSTTFSELMQAEQERTLDGMAERAELAFRLGTTPTREDRASQMARAVGLLSNLRNLDRKSYLPALLLIHASMERGEGQSLLYNIFTLVDRYPDIFRTPLDIQKYYGDPSILDSQVRSYLRFGDSSSATLHGYVIQAYAAWALNDKARVREALSKLDQLRLKQEPDPNVMRFYFAMGNAVAKD